MCWNTFTWKNFTLTSPNPNPNPSNSNPSNPNPSNPNPSNRNPLTLSLLRTAAAAPFQRFYPSEKSNDLRTRKAVCHGTVTL